MNFKPEKTIPSTHPTNLTPDDLVGMEPANTQMVDFQQHLAALTREAMRIQTQMNQLLESIQKVSQLAATLPSQTMDLGVGSVLSPMWNSESAIELLSEHTGKKWTHPKLLAVAIARGWRSAGKGHPPIASLFCTKVLSRYNPEGTIVYTHRALQYILENPEAGWKMATKSPV